MSKAELTRESIKLTTFDDDIITRMPANFAFMLLNSDKSYVALAEAINMKKGTVRSRLHRAREMLVKMREEKRVLPS